MQTLQLHTQTASDEMTAACTALDSLISQMNADANWAGQNKIAFMAWLDLLRQYQAKLADPSIGPAMVSALVTFQNSLVEYDTDSTVYNTLKGIG
jgi:hypothetical protein